MDEEGCILLFECVKGLPITGPEGNGRQLACLKPLKQVQGWLGAKLRRRAQPSSEDCEHSVLTSDPVPFC